MLLYGNSGLLQICFYFDVFDHFSVSYESIELTTIILITETREQGEVTTMKSKQMNWETKDPES